MKLSLQHSLNFLFKNVLLRVTMLNVNDEIKLKGRTANEESKNRPERR